MFSPAPAALGNLITIPSCSAGEMRRSGANIRYHRLASRYDAPPKLHSHYVRVRSS